MSKKAHEHEESTPRPVVHVEHGARAHGEVREGDLPQVVKMGEGDADLWPGDSRHPPADVAKQEHKRGGKHQHFRFEGDKAFALNAEGKEVQVDPGNARDAENACKDGDEASVRKVAADVARLYPVA